MSYLIGSFEIDEAARSLALDGQPQRVQPLVLDLLLYLVADAGRVFPRARCHHYTKRQAVDGGQ